MTALLATVVVLGVLIFIHELGHFWAAKAVGIEVQRFSIGLGPKVLGFRRGETEYVLSLIPLGGYVKMGGMDDEVAESLEGGRSGGPVTDPERAYDRKPVWARTLVISAGVLMNAAFAFLIYVAVSAGWGRSVLDTRTVDSVDVARLPAGAQALSEIPSGAQIVRVAGTGVAHWNAISEAIATAAPGTVTIEFAEPAGSVSVELPEDPSGRQAIAQALEPRIAPVVLAVTPGSPAERGGIEGGDRILAVDGEEVTSWNRFVALVRERPDQRTEVVLDRDGVRLIRPITPERQRIEDPVTGEEREIGYAGLAPRTPLTSVRVPFAEAVGLGARETVAVTGFILGSLRDLVSGDVSPRNLGSIVTIGQASGEAAREGIEVFLRFMALFSLNLAVLNLLPIPVLDGGHLVFLAIEAVRGKALSIEQRARWSQVGFVLLAGIMLFALSNDVIRLLGF